MDSLFLFLAPVFLFIQVIRIAKIFIVYNDRIVIRRPFAIFKKELWSYFGNWSAWIIIGAFSLISALFLFFFEKVNLQKKTEFINIYRN